jgi:hypothetical protein
MPHKANKRKAIQEAKRRAAAAEEARKNKKWPGTRRVAMIAHHNGSQATLISLLLGAGVFDGPDVLVKKDTQ